MNPKFSVSIPGKRKKIYYTVTRQTLKPQVSNRLPTYFPGINQVPPIINFWRILRILSIVLNKKKEKTIKYIIPKHISEDEKLVQIIYACSGLLSRKTLRWTEPVDINYSAEDCEIMGYLWTLLTYKEYGSNYIIHDSLKNELYNLFKIYRKDSNLPEQFPYYDVHLEIKYELIRPLEDSFKKLQTKLKEEYRNKHHGRSILDPDWSSETGGIPDAKRKEILEMMIKITRDYLLKKVGGTTYKMVMMVNGKKGWQKLRPEYKPDCESQYAYYEIDPYSGAMTRQDSIVHTDFYRHHRQQSANASASASASASRTYISSPAASSSSDEDDTITLRCRKRKRRRGSP